MGETREEIDHLLILANLAKEHCLSVWRDGQNDCFPIAAGSLALISTLFTWSWIDVCLSSRVCYSMFWHSPRALPKLLPVWLPVILPPMKENTKVLALKAIKAFSLLSPAYSSSWGTDLISYLKATFHLPPRLSVTSWYIPDQFLLIITPCLALSTIISSLLLITVSVL